MDVFISVGRTSTPEQAAFVKLIEDTLVRNGLTPQTVGRTLFRNENPLKTITDLMSNCSGVVVIAFERIYIERGIERRGATDQTLISDLGVTTVWNQIEAGMAHILGVPILVMAERSVRREGLLENSLDAYVIDIDLDEATISTPTFQGVFDDWKKRVKDFKPRGKESGLEKPLSALTIRDLIQAATPAQLKGFYLAVLAAVIAIAGVGFKVGEILTKQAAIEASLAKKNS